MRTEEPENVKGKGKGKGLTQKSTSELNILPGSTKSNRGNPDLPDPAHHSVPEDPLTAYQGPMEADFPNLVASGNIDPRLLGEEEAADAYVDQKELETLNSTILLTEEAGDEMEEAALEGLFDSPQTTDVSTFIARYSSINITTNSRFALAWARVQAGKSEEVRGLAPRGNSRDDATPFEYGCTKNPRVSIPCHTAVQSSATRESV